MKYVMFKKDINGLATHFVPIIFPNLIAHNEAAEAMLKGPLEGFEVHSAGTVLIHEIGIAGESLTLEVKSDGENDKRRIMLNDYGGSME